MQAIRNGFLLVFLLVSGMIFAAGSVETGKSEKAEADFVTVTDDRGVEVKVKKHVERIATFPIPHPHIIAAIDGGVGRIIGAHPMSVSAAKISIFGKIAPGLSAAETGYLKGQTLNVEELARIKPDVFFTDAALAGMENLEKTGIPVVYLGLIKEKVAYKNSEVEAFSPKETMKNWVEITSKVLGKEESETSRISEVWSAVEKEISDKIAGVPLDARPKILIMFQTKNLSVAGSGTFGHYWIARTGGINAAEELKGNHPAQVKVGSFEDIMKWNPDIVYLTNFEDTMPEDLYAGKIAGQDWSKIEAVKNRRVYRIPLGIYRWYPPSLDGPLMLKWMAKMNYPDLFDYDMEKEIAEYFKRFHHYSPSPEEIRAILDPASTGNL